MITEPGILQIFPTDSLTDRASRLLSVEDSDVVDLTTVVVNTGRASRTPTRSTLGTEIPAHARAQNNNAADEDSSTASELAKLLKEIGGRREARTRDLGVANAALSQLS